MRSRSQTDTASERFGTCKKTVADDRNASPLNYGVERLLFRRRLVARSTDRSGSVASELSTGVWRATAGSSATRARDNLEVVQMPDGNMNFKKMKPALKLRTWDGVEVDCLFASDDQRVLNLKLGDKITLRGEYQQISSRLAMLRNCKFAY